MRPRLKAAENGGRQRPEDDAPHASMRPRLKAAENPVPPGKLTLNVTCFNEAAALSRGKPVSALVGRVRVAELQ